MKILQNQENFSTSEYRSYATSLVQALNVINIPVWLKKRYSNDIISGFLMFLCADKFDVVVTVSHRPAVVFGLLSRIFCKKSTIHVAKEFFFEIDHAKGCISIKKWLIFAIYRFALKNVSAVIVNATGEIFSYSKALSLPESRFYFIPWPSNINEPSMLAQNNGSVLSVGRSLRDWQTFFKAVDGLPIECVVVASTNDLVGLVIPSNVHVFCDISRDKYLDLLVQSKIVCIPLVETNRSTGQASFLEAMAFGKPVIVTKVVGSMDYIKSTENGILYDPGNFKELRSYIIRLYNDEVIRAKIGNSGLQSVINIFNKKNYANCMLDIFKKLLDTK